MEKKKFLSLTALFCLMLGGCEVTPNGSSKGTTSGTNSTASSNVSNTSTNSGDVLGITAVTISNKDALQAAWYVGDDNRRVDISLVANGVTLDQALADGSLQIISSDEDVVKVNGKRIEAVNVGSATITAFVSNSINDSVIVTVSQRTYDAPTITITPEEGMVYDTISGTSVNLPKMTCVDNYGTDLSSYVEITSNLDPYATITPELFFSTVEGEHTLTYKVVHPNDETKESTATFVVNVYRQLFRDKGDWSVENELAPNDQQKATTTNTGFGTVQLNYDASSYYYIESLVEMPTNHSGGHQIGISHYNPDNTSKFLVFDMDLGDYNWKIKDFKTNGDGSWSLEGEIDNWRLGEYFLKDVPTTEETTIKLGVLRYGREFYMFVNDGYVGMTTNKEYSNVNTYPGLFTHAGSDGTKFTNINYISGTEEVKAKLDSLIGNGETLITNYVARGYEWALESQNIDNKNFSVNPISDERGLNFDFTSETTHHNSGMVSLYQYFDDDFTFEFDYVPTTEETTGGDHKMWLEARPLNNSDYSGEIFWIGTKFREADAEQMLKAITTEVTGEIWNTETITNSRAGMHYKVTRIVNETDGKCYFDLVITSLADPTQVVEFQDLAYSGTGWNDKLILIWHNTNIAGQFSNIKWSTTLEA